MIKNGVDCRARMRTNSCMSKQKLHNAASGNLNSSQIFAPWSDWESFRPVNTFSGHEKTDISRVS